MFISTLDVAVLTSTGGSPAASYSEQRERNLKLTLRDRNMRHCVACDKVGVPCVLLSSSHHGCHSTGAAEFSPSGSPAAESADPIRKHDLSLLLTHDRCQLPLQLLLLPRLRGTIPAAIQASTCTEIEETRHATRAMRCDVVPPISLCQSPIARSEAAPSESVYKLAIQPKVWYPPPNHVAP